MKYTCSPIMILAGGTGGHVFPALAVANEIKQQSVPIVWVGTKKGIEAKVVTQAGYPIEWILIGGLRGKNYATYLLAPFKLVLAELQALWLLIKYRPCAVLGMGGFVAGPVGLMAALLRRPLIIHEQNAIAGLTNRLLAPFAKHILTGFPNVFLHKQAELVGNPVRTEISQLKREYMIAEPVDRSLRVLVVGGSLGAQVLNKTVPAALAQIPAIQRPEIWHQAGGNKLEYTQAKYNSHCVNARVDEFITVMQEAYAWADLVICRAGAITVAELAVAGVGAVFVPYPYAVDDHQTENAAALVKAGAAFMLQENELSASKLAELLRELTSQRTKLKTLAAAVSVFAKPHAAKEVAKICLQACEKKMTAAKS